MSKKLSEMSLEELFPVILTEHQSDWNKWYSEEMYDELPMPKKKK